MTQEIAVLMAAYNAERTIRRSLEALLADPQPKRVFIIDDCSETPVAQIVDPLPDNVEIIRLAQNCGPAEARNAGLARILNEDYQFIAIRDADDVCRPNMLAKQVAFLEANPHVGIVGGWEHAIDESGEFVSDSAYLCGPEEIRQTLFLKMSISHPTVMVRADVFRHVGGYSPHYYAAEDYEFIRRVANHYQVANIPEFVIDYRLSQNGMSAKHRKRQLIDRLSVQFKYFEFSNFRSWTGLVRTLLLLGLPIKRRKPDTLSEAAIAAACASAGSLPYITSPGTNPSVADIAEEQEDAKEYTIGEAVTLRRVS
jgi:glycosyltransferase involved in cell wall biosynthesis